MKIEMFEMACEHVDPFVDMLEVRLDGETAGYITRVGDLYIPLNVDRKFLTQELDAVDAGEAMGFSQVARDSRDDALRAICGHTLNMPVSHLEKIGDLS